MRVSLFLYITSGLKFYEPNLLTDVIAACQIRFHLKFKAKKRKHLKNKKKQMQKCVPFSFSCVDYQYTLTTAEITFSQRTESKKSESRNCEKKNSVIAVNLIAVNAAPSCTVPAAVKVIER